MRKLPAPDRLYDLIVTRGQSYSTVAMAYDVGRSVVANTFKRDCRAAGLEWPLGRDVGEATGRGLRSITVDATIIAEVIQEYMEINNVSQRRLETMTGVSQATFSNLLLGKEDRMRASTARKLLKAIGENVPDSLNDWRPRRIEKAYLNKPAPKLKRAEDVLDDWAFLRSCGWTSAEKIAARLGMSLAALEIMLRRHRGDPRVGDLTWVFLDDSKVPLV